MYHKLETVAAETSSNQLDENSEVVKAVARLAGVSTHAILAQMRRMQHLPNEVRQHASGFSGISLGRVELPVMNRGVVRKDGWRAATIGEDSITPKLSRDQVAVSVPEYMARSLPGNEALDEASAEQRDGDVATLREFVGKMSDEKE